MDVVDYAKSVNAYLTDYIKFADVKAGALVTLTLGVAGGLSAIVQHLLDFHQKARRAVPDSTAALVIFTAVAAAVALAGCVAALIPRLKTSSSSLNSFPDIISHKNGRSYAQAVNAINPSDICEHFSQHNFTLAVVASKKFYWVQFAIYSLAVAILGVLALACSDALLRVA